ncbi:MAG: ribosome small subunit-dependent GTPase A [Spirochaetales bacterium]|nr:ribosome small subunit-dependent GTPase A [Spirochaetales bacterium]
MDGVVIAGSVGSFLVECEDGVRRCGIKGKVLKGEGADGRYNALAPGDRVTVEPDPIDADKGSVTALVPRRNLFWRYNEKGRARQAIAANLDLVVCVASPVLPPFRPRFVDRVAMMAELGSVPLLIVLNKADLGLDDDTAARLEDYGRLGYGVHLCSARTGEGVEELRAKLRGLETAFVGQSGVGKSSVLNALEPGLSRRVGEVSEKYERGKHTTTQAVLVRLSDGETRIVDTPGFRRLAVRGLEAAEVGPLFPEIRAVSGGCALGARCRHLDEPGCAVLKAVEAGTIHDDRYESYARVLAELEFEETPKWAKKLGRPRRDYGYEHDDD